MHALQNTASGSFSVPQLAQVITSQILRVVTLEKHGHFARTGEHRQAIALTSIDGRGDGQLRQFSRRRRLRA
ncbi:MAG TPA: hypothetical protein VFP34_12115 [Microlunatus sp.]|nr:hypothetical protein [Microlunatus sp.]